ncbi:MAG: diguanylate cyclase [Deltaproteobacteria bacterium]|nr:diguanylate cyclase [Deltaproteobacteria bacterium]
MSTATQMQSPDAIAELARIWKRYEGDPDGAIRAITETAARALKTARASVWLLAEDASEMTCVDLFEAAENRHSSGTVLTASDFPAYFAAMLEEETIAAENAHTDPRTSEFSATYLAPLGIGSMLDAPIRTGLRLVGVLCHEHVGGPRVWGLGERKDAAFLASLASLTLELKNRAMREALLAATLESTGEGILASDDKRVLAYNQRFLDMWKLDAKAMRSLDGVRGHIAARTSGSGLASQANEAFAGEAGETVDVLELDDGRVFERSSRPQLMGKVVVGRVWSFREITAQRRTESALRASEAKMRDLAILDGLTGLFNRRHVLELLQEAIDRAVAAGERLCIGLVDLDDFKKVNDELGHLVGDAVLRDFAKQLTQRFRASDHIGRYGGEEFLIVLRGANTAAAVRVFEEVRTGFRAREFGDLPKYTFSAGISELGVDGVDGTELLSRADVRLYEAKRTGRDRTFGGA